ncbi:MAG: hypothetical protein JWN70_5137 [Planctomycetaceae bacterium]|nr:hypothetical protein [Planctomycetaceae bacterium]
MRKTILAWTATALVVSSQQLLLAQSKRPVRDAADSSSRAAVARIPDSDDEESGVGLDFESITEDSDYESIAPKVIKTRSGKTQLTSAEDSVLIMPDSDPIVEGVRTETVSAPNCPEFWEHRSGVWGEYLFWRPRGADVTYASTVDGTLATSVPVGDRSVAAFKYDSGVRAGANLALDSCSSITAGYTWFRTSANDSINLPGGGGSFIAAETVHPNTINVAADSLSASAIHDLSLQMADLNYKGLIWGDDCFAINSIVGVRYANLEQQFGAVYSILGTTTVDTNINFRGVGPRFGFEAERLVNNHGFMVYSKGAVNFLVGTCAADFTQTNVFAGTQAKTALQDSRILTIPELELGGGWQSCNGRFRLTAGYYLAAWFNMLTTPEYLGTIRTTQNTYESQIKTLTLDGLTVRAEARY